MCKQTEHQLKWNQQMKQGFDYQTLVTSPAMSTVAKGSARREGVNM